MMTSTMAGVREPSPNPVNAEALADFGVEPVYSSNQPGMKIMKLLKTIAAILLMSALMISLSACEDQGPMEEAGEKVDDTVDDAGDAIDDATDDD